MSMTEIKDERQQKVEEIQEIQSKLNDLPEGDKRYIAGYVDGKLDEKLQRRAEQKGE